MDLWQLQIFCKVVDLRSFSRAARAVHLSQPTISSHIQALEQHFGCQLIDRMPRAALPTSAGAVLHRYAKRLLALRDETEAALAEHQGFVRGQLRIGGSTIPGDYLLPPVIGGFTQIHPEVQVSLVIGDSREIIDRVLEGDVEVGVVGARTGERQAIQEKLVDDELRLIVPPGHPLVDRQPVPLERLAETPFIVRERGSGTLAAIETSLQRSGSGLKALSIKAEMGSTEAVIQAIRCGLGVSILSPVAVADDLAGGRLQALAIAGVDLRRAFYLTRHRQRTASPIGALFSAYIVDRLRA